MKHPVRLGFITSVATICLAVFFTGCSSNSGTVSHAPIAYFELIGVAGNMSVSIDGGEAISLEPKSKSIRLQVEPGRHRIKVSKAGEIILDRKVLVSDQQTLEIRLP